MNWEMGRWWRPLGKFAFVLVGMVVFLMGCGGVELEVDGSAGMVMVRDTDYLVTEIRMEVDTPRHRSIEMRALSVPGARKSLHYDRIEPGYVYQGDTSLLRERGLVYMTVYAESMGDNGRACFIFRIDRSVRGRSVVAQEGRPCSTN